MSIGEKKIQQYKLDAVAALKEKFQSAHDYIFADYRGLTVEQITDLRKKLKEKNSEFKVIKNRYARIAFKELNFSGVEAQLVGPTAIALVTKESAEAAKVLYEYSRDFSLKVKGGLIDGTLFSAEQVEQYSKLPTRAELMAQLMGSLNAPLTNLLFAMNGITQKLIRTLQAVADKKAAA
ncbi:MAG: 50S ribosomal protein L10 [Spirochaetota bacterium]